jgi:hypothetical protein
VGRVSLPPLRAASGPLTLQLRLASPRPAGVEAPRVQVEIDGRTVGRTAALDPEFRTYSLLLDASASNALLSGATMLTLRMPTFVPAEAGGDDHRRLGVAVDWIRISRP